jgi:hypothetical protein
MFDPFETAIKAMPNGKLAELDRDIDSQLGLLQDQHQKVQQELAKRGAGASRQNRPAKAAKSPKGSRTAKRSKRGIGKERQAFIQQLVDGAPGEQWLPSELQKRLEEREGGTVSRDSIRNLTRDMVASGNVARHPSGDGITGASGAAASNGSPEAAT